MGPRVMGRSPTTEAFARAIHAVVQAGDGTVIVSRGDWLTGPIHLRSRVGMHVEVGATVRFSASFQKYLPGGVHRLGGGRVPQLFTVDLCP